MTFPQPIGLLNTAVPVVVLGAFAAGLPYALRRSTASHVETAVIIWASAGLVLLLSGGVFALVYHWQGAEVVAAFGDSAWQTTRFFLARGLGSALIWGPILGLVWLNFAQRVEEERARRRRGEE